MFKYYKMVAQTVEKFIISVVITSFLENCMPHTYIQTNLASWINDAKGDKKIKIVAIFFIKH